MVDNEDLQFYPPRLWGLDYHFSAYNKMYIADVVNMPEYPQFSGAYCYNNHPIYKVDVVGIIVKKSENSKCFIYAVDDGTGVILSCCWKENLYRSTDYSGALANLPPCLKTKVQEIQGDSIDASEGYSLGDMLHVKGKVKVFRDQKEIVANYHNKVDNPMFQVFRMLELPRLYRLYFDKPFQPPKKVQAALVARQQSDGKLQVGTAEDLKNIIFNYISMCDHLIDLDPNDLLKYSKVKDVFTEDDRKRRNKLNVLKGASVEEMDKERNADEQTEKTLPVVLQALTRLEDDGLVTRRSDRRMLYEVLIHRSKLERRIQMILSEEAGKPKYSMTGCHYLHIVDELHKTYQYARVKKEAVMYCLQKLEAQSDVIRTTHAHYLPCNF